MTHDQDRMRVILVDDHPVIRGGLKAFLSQEGFEVLATPGTVQEALGLLPGANAQLIVVDLTLEQGSGLDLLRAAATLCPHSRFVVYSVHEDGDKVRQAMQAGAMGYVTKREDPDVLLNALQEVGAGRRFLSPRAARAMADVVAHVPLPAPQEALSPQELQVFVLTGEGHTPQSIAERMGISVRTIETYYSRIVDKLALGGRKELRLSATNWVRKTL